MKTIKELKEMSTEQLIIELVMTCNDMTKDAKKREDRVFKLLSERNVIDYDNMVEEYKKALLW